MRRHRRWAALRESAGCSWDRTWCSSILESGIGVALGLMRLDALFRVRSEDPRGSLGGVLAGASRHHNGGIHDC